MYLKYYSFISGIPKYIKDFFRMNDEYIDFISIKFPDEFVEKLATNKKNKICL